MKKASLKEEVDRMTIEQLVGVLINDTKEAVQENGVQFMMKRMEEVLAETFKGRKTPRFARGIFLITLQCVVKELYAIPGHKLDVAHGIDRRGPWLTAICSSGSYAFWRTNSERSVFHNWDREVCHVENSD